MLRHAWLLPFVVLELSACGSAPNDLWGSIDESFSLDFDRVDISKQNLDLIIAYIKVLNGDAGEKMCKVTVQTANLNIQSNSDIAEDVFMKRVTVQRVASVGGEFPLVTGGHMHFATYEFQNGGSMEGDFTVLFKTGRTLFGAFRGTVVEIDTN